MIGFSPRKNDLTLYLMPELDGQEALLANLGKHKTGVSCLYLKRLSDVDLPTLEALVERRAAAHGGAAHRLTALDLDFHAGPRQHHVHAVLLADDAGQGFAGVVFAVHQHHRRPVADVARTSPPGPAGRHAPTGRPRCAAAR